MTKIDIMILNTECRVKALTKSLNEAKESIQHTLSMPNEIDSMSIMQNAKIIGELQTEIRTLNEQIQMLKSLQ